MKLTKFPIFCQSCRKHIENLSNMLVMDELMPQAFCSEDCALDFYTPYISFFEKQETQLRKVLNLEESLNLSNEEQEEILKKSLSNPSSSYFKTDELGDRFFYFLTKNEDKIFSIAILKVFEDKPAFLIHLIITSSKDLFEYYQEDKSFDFAGDSERKLEKKEITIGKDTIEMVEQLKSEYLAQLLEDRDDDNDIGFEKFLLYDNCLDKTLSEPDESYLFTDSENRIICTQIKAFERNGESFFYFVICLKITDSDHLNENEEFLVPILSFPSNDSSLYEDYKKGVCQTKKSLN